MVFFKVFSMADGVNIVQSFWAAQSRTIDISPVVIA